MILQTFGTIPEGQAILYIGLLAVILASIVAFPNPAAAILWGLTFIFFVFHLFLYTPIQLFYLALILTSITLITGMAVRWSVRA